VTAELLGVDLDDLAVYVGATSIERSADDESFHLVEALIGALQRSVQLPFEPAAVQAGASFESGALTVVVPKSEQQQPKEHIEVQPAFQAQRQQARPQKEGNEGAKH
jgi:HSP20 family molecular chaperone IbpA